MNLKCPPPNSCSIDDQTAQTRINLYLNYKKPMLDKLIGYKNEITCIEYSPKIFLELLKRVADPVNPTMPTTPLYDGVRVYFATYCWDPNDCDGNACIPEDPASPTGDCRDNLTLIFVPTSNGGQDDISNCMIIKTHKSQEEIYVLPNPASSPKGKDVVSRWINNYQYGKRISLATEARFRTGNLGFEETKSLWYSLYVIQDLITYINCLLGDTPVLTSIELKPSAYISPETGLDSSKYQPYQLTLIFAFILGNPLVEGGPTKILYFGSKSKKEGLESGGGGSSDTGIPCPPATQCNGSNLPQG